jgi:hypothetical protein
LSSLKEILKIPGYSFHQKIPTSQLNKICQIVSRTYVRNCFFFHFRGKYLEFYLQSLITKLQFIKMAHANRTTFSKVLRRKIAYLPPCLAKILPKFLSKKLPGVSQNRKNIILSPKSKKF